MKLASAAKPFAFQIVHLRFYVVFSPDTRPINPSVEPETIIAMLFIRVHHPFQLLITRGIRASDASERIKAMWAKRREFGWVMPNATKEKLAKKEVSAETRAKMSAAAKARGMKPLSEEARKKISDSTKKAWQNPEVTQRRLSAMKAARKKDTE